MADPFVIWFTSGTPACPSSSMNLGLHQPQRRLMVVDDDHDLVDALCEWIGLSSNWVAMPAYGPAQAIAQTGDSPPDAILLDMEMMGANGFDTADRIGRASGAKHSAILAMTGNAELRDAALRDPRFAASMLKPADPGRLLVLLSALVPEH